MKPAGEIFGKGEPVVSRSKIKGMVFTALSALLFGITPALASMSYELGSMPETLTFYRNLLVLPVLAAVMGIRRISFRLPLRTLGTIVLVGVLGRGITTLLLYSLCIYRGGDSDHSAFPLSGIRGGNLPSVFPRTDRAGPPDCPRVSLRRDRLFSGRRRWGAQWIRSGGDFRVDVCLLYRGDG